MVLPSKTIELIEQIAKKLEKWAKNWGKRLLKNKPNNLRQFCQSFLAEFNNTDIPQLAFKMEFHSGLNKALEGFELVLERLCQHMPNMATLVQKKHKDLMAEAKLIGKLSEGDPVWFKKFNNSRNSAISLAKTLWHVVEMAKEDVSSEKLGQTKEHVLSKETVQLYIELNLAERLLIIGTDELRISSELVWDFLKTLASNIKSNRITPRIDDSRNWKNAVDTLRRKIGKDRLHKVVCFSNGGYFLSGAVKVKYGSQVGIRKTRG